MLPPIDDLYRLAPELAFCGFGMLVMLLEPFVSAARKKWLRVPALAGASIGLAATALPATPPGATYDGLLRIDTVSIFLHLIVGAVAVLVVLSSAHYLEREKLPPGEFYALVLFATAGMGIM